MTGPLKARLTLALVLVAGFAVRLPHLADPPLRFHPTRQYRSAVIARGYYLDQMSGLTTQQREAARAIASAEGSVEPPVIEHLAVWAYQAAGREDLRLPRLISVLAWTASGAALWWLTAQLFSTPAVVASVVLVMFLPFGITASQAFQPDPLMTALTTVTLAVAVHHDRRRGVLALVLLTVSAGAAAFVKPMAVFFILPAVFALAVRRLRWIRGLAFVSMWALAFSLPTAAYYYYYVLRVAPAAFSDRIFAPLLFDPAFWQDWAVMLNRVAWLPVVVCGLAGLAFAGKQTRALLSALWVGYLLFGLVFTHYIHTHDYYSLPLIPIVALSTAALVDAVGRAVPSGSLRRALAGAGTAVLIVGIGASLHASDLFRSAADLEAEVARYERIGRAVGHSTRVISLDGSYGIPLSYHGFISASNWPLSIDLAFDRLSGRREVPAAERLPVLKGAEFFVATIQAELDAQTELREFLHERFPVIDREGQPDRWQFVVYDLRRAGVSVRPERVSVFVRTNGTVASRQSLALQSLGASRWRIDVPTPELFQVQPTEGSGPATLWILPRSVSSEIDKTVDVPIYTDESDLPAGRVTVRFKSIQSATASAPFGWVDVPSDPVVVGTDPVMFVGWALDDLDLRRVWAGYVDRSGQVVPLGDATRGGMRPDVAAVHPNSHDIFNAAWTFTLRPEVLARIPRPVVVRFYAEDGEGRRAEIGTRTITTTR